MRNKNKKERGKENKNQEREAEKKKMGCNTSRNWNDNRIHYSAYETNRLLAL
jgi:hypothetical protein